MFKIILHLRQITLQCSSPSYSSHRKILHFRLFWVGRKRNGVTAENGTAPWDTLPRSLENKMRLQVVIGLCKRKETVALISQNRRYGNNLK